MNRREVLFGVRDSFLCSAFCSCRRDRVLWRRCLEQMVRVLCTTTNLNEFPSSFLLPPHYCGLWAGSIPFRATVNKQCETRGLFMSLVIHYWIGDVLQDSQGLSASEMTHIVSGGALNSTHSVTCVRLPYMLFRVRAIRRETYFSWNCSLKLKVINLLGSIREISGVGCSLQVAVFTEMVLLLLCDHSMQDCAVEITLTHGHVRSVPVERATSFAPNVPQEHRDYTNLYKRKIAVSRHLHYCIYVPERDPDASLDIRNSLATLYPEHHQDWGSSLLHHMQAICKRGSSRL